MDALFDVQDSALNSSLAEILANLAEAEAAAAMGTTDAAMMKSSAHRAAAGSPLLGDHDILSNSLQEFLKYEDPHSPIIPGYAEPYEGADDAVPTSNGANKMSTSSRSPRFVIQRNPSFTPSLKGFLFSKDDDGNNVVGRMMETTNATSCSLTGSGSDSSDPARTYLPRLTDGSVSVLHSLENDLNHDLSSLEDSMHSSDDTSSSFNDRGDNKVVTEVVDLGPTKDELEKNLRNREIEDHGVMDSPAPPNTELKRKPSKGTIVVAAQRRVETAESSNEQAVVVTGKTPSAPSVPMAERSPKQPESRSKPRAAVEKDIVFAPTAALGADADPPTASPAAPAPEKTGPTSRQKEQPSLQKAIESPKTPPKPSSMPESPTERRSEQQTTEPAAKQPEPSKVKSPKSPRRASVGNDRVVTSPTTSPSRRSASRTRRSSIGSSSSRPRNAPASVPLDSSNSPKLRSKSSDSQTGKMSDGTQKSEIPARVLPQVPEPNDPNLASSKGLPSETPVVPPKSPTGAMSRTVDLPAARAPASPKSPHRELRLKIQIDELRSPKNAGDGVSQDGDGTEDEALPQMLKMLLDGVANKIRKHAKQESMRKIRGKEGPSSQDTESTVKGARQVAQSPTIVGSSESPKQRIKVRIDKSKAASPRKDGTSASVSPSKSGRRRILLSKPEETVDDFDPHSIGKDDVVGNREPKRDPSLSPRRHKDRSSEKERSRSRSSKNETGNRDNQHREDDGNPLKVARPESVRERPRRSSMDRETSSRRMSGAGQDERVRSKSSSKEKDRQSSRSRSRASTATSRSKVPRSAVENDETQSSSLKAKLDSGAERHSRTSGSKSVCSKSSRKRREETNPEDTKDSSHHRSSKASSSGKEKSSLASTIESGAKTKSGISSSRSVCSRSSRKKRDGSEEGRLSRSYHSRSIHSSSKSVRSSSRSVHSTSRSSSKSRTREPKNEDIDAPSFKTSVSSHGSSEVNEAIEYDFNDDVPQKADDSGDRRGRSFRRGSGSSTSRGRSLSARSLGSEAVSSLKKSGRSQSQRQLSSDRASSLSGSRRSQSHRHLKSGEETEYKLGLGGDSAEMSKRAARSGSQPLTSTRNTRHDSSRSESLERSGTSRSRSRPATENRKELSLSGLSRSQIEEGAKSVASSASDRTPRRSGGRGPSPNARSRTQPTSLLSQTGKSSIGQQAPEPPGLSPVVQTQVTTTVSRLRGVQKALSFRDLFARDPDPWQEFTSPTRQPKLSCIPVAGTSTSIATTTASSTKSRTMPKFLSAVGSSFQRSASARFPEVTKSELDASFESFHPFETSGDGLEAADKRPTTAETVKSSMSSASSSSASSSSPPPAPGPPPQRTQPAPAGRAGHGWTQKLFR